MNKIRIGIVLLTCGIFIAFTLGAKSCVNRNNKAKSGSSNVSTFMINAPSNLSANAVSFTQINLSWSDNSNNEDEFEIERAINGITYTLLATVSANMTSYSDPGLSPSTTYYYRVRALNTIGDRSEWSNIANAFTFNWDWVPTTWTAIAAGEFHSLAMDSNGNVWAWGNNDWWQLGIGDTSVTYRTYPTLIASDIDWQPFTSVTAIFAGSISNHNFALKTDGTLWGWGANGAGQLGTGDTATTEAPLQIGIDSDWLSVSVGIVHSTGLKTDNTLWSWGYNMYGQLGLGDVEPRLTPTQVGTYSDWSIISVGGSRNTSYFDGHSFAIKNNGSLWAWGYNNSGQLGDGTYAMRTTPKQIGTESDWVSVVSGGNNYTIGLKSAETLWAWGWNWYGELGDGTTYNRTTPRQIGTESDWAFVTAGANHTLGLKSNNTLWAWGYNSSGQLGDGTTDNRTTPRQIGTESDWLSVTAGGDHTIGIKTGGTIWAWGYNNSGQLGLGDAISRNIPCPLGSPITPSDLIITVISTSQIDLSWQDKSNNETGFIIERKTGVTGTWEILITVGQNVTSYSDTTVSQGNIYYYRVRSYNNIGTSLYSNDATPSLSAPSLLMLTVVSNTQINLSWTDNSPDEFGFKIERKYGVTGSYIEIGTVGTNTTIYPDTTVTLNNTYYYRVWAYNAFTNSSYSNQATPSLSAPSPLTLTVISNTQINLSWTDNSSDEAGFQIERKIGVNGMWEQIAITNTNITSYSDITSTGFTPSTTYYYRVRAYNAFADSAYSNEAHSAISGTWGQVSAGSAHTIGLRSAGTLWAWGYNSSGQLGDGTITKRTTPRQIGTESDWASVSADNHSIGLKSAGTLWVWGYNGYGQLGMGDLISRNTPTQISAESDWVSMTTGVNHTIGLKSNNTLWAWGDNSYGQLGDGTITKRTTPRQIGTESDWVSFSAGELHTIGIKTNNIIWAWGLNLYGQLGDGTTNDRYTPRQIGTESDWLSQGVTTGYVHTIGLKSNNTLWAWGRNNYGQLGDGTITQRTTPRQIGTDSDWSSVSAGGYHTIGIKFTNSIWVWGLNDVGQLGDGTQTGRYTPRQVDADTDWFSVSAGGSHTIGTKFNNTLWAWGNNNYGQLGLGVTTININTPTLVGE